MFRGGEDIALVHVTSPEFHEKFEKETWVCFYHADASMNGQEKQLQKKLDKESQETPKQSKDVFVNEEPPRVKKSVKSAPTKNKTVTNVDEKYKCEKKGSSSAPSKLKFVDINKGGNNETKKEKSSKLGLAKPKLGNLAEEGMKDAGLEEEK